MLDAGCWLLDSTNREVIPPMRILPGLKVRKTFPQITQIHADSC
jgi:hypothetical protein